MKLRFKVNQAVLFRQGIDAPKSIVHLEVDPAKLEQVDRDLIALHMNGIDVFQLHSEEDGGYTLSNEHVVANAITIEALLAALRSALDARVHTP